MGIYDLTEETLKTKLGQINDLAELEGFANRRRYFPDAPRWDDNQRGMILARKYELERIYGPYKSKN